MKKYIFFIFLLIIFFIQITESEVEGRNGLSLDQKIRELTLMRSKDTVLRFDSDMFRKYVASRPRNYSIVVMLNMGPNRKHCPTCRKGDVKIEILVYYYRRSKACSNNLFFATVDFEKSKDIFEMLNVTLVPTFIHFPAHGKPKAGDTLDYTVTGLHPVAIARWVARRTGVEFYVRDSIDYTKIIVTSLLAVAGFITGSGIAYFWKLLRTWVFSKTNIAIASLFFCFAMVSGQMWNHISQPPFMYPGDFTYISGTTKWQFGMESYVVALYNCAISVGMILMIEAASQKGHRRKRQVAVIVGLLLIVIFFSVLLSLVKVKKELYPYSYLLNEIPQWFRSYFPMSDSNISSDK